MKHALAVLIAAAIAAPLIARQPPAFRSATDLVEVDVVAQDRNGRFVADLRADEFEVREEGAPQQVDAMYVVDGATTRLIADPTKAPDAPAAQGAIAPPRPARMFIAFFDNGHLTPTGFKRVQAGALALFSKEFSPGDIGGVVADGHLTNNRMTSDREELLAAVRNAKPGQRANARRFDQTMWPRMSDIEAIRIVMNNDQAVLGEAIRRACADDPALCPNADAAVRGKAAQMTGDVRAETGQTMRSVLTLVNGLARFDGRKTILFLTEGFMAQESWPLVQETIGQAARANARIYTLDARGLDRSGMADYLSGAFGRDEGVSSNLLKQMDFSEDAMNSLAVDTGGFVVRNQNFFDAAVKQIVADASTYYILGYRSLKAPDGKFRRIVVKVKRPGVLIRARRGYVATPKPTPATSAAAVATGATTGGARGSTTDGARGSVADGARGFPGPPKPGTGEGGSRATPGHPPEPDPPEAIDAPAAVMPPAPSQGVRLRPDAGKHVELLLKNETGDAAAKAGWDAYQRGDVSNARAALTTAAADPGAHPWIHYALGLSQYALREFHDATNEWEAVRRAQPDFEPVYFDLVDGYLQLRDPAQAIRVLRSAQDRWPKDPEVFSALGVVQTSQGTLDAAVKSFEEAVGLAPNDAVSHFNLGRALEMRYYRTRRYVEQLRAWVSNEHDRDGAIAHYRACIDLGGAFEKSAREGLARLNWAPKP